jgi:hypothetical protein
MKFTITLALTFFGFLANAQIVTSKVLVQQIKTKAQNYLNSDSQYPKNRIAVNWSDVSALHPRIDKKILEKTNNAEIDAKIDSLIAIDKASPGYPKATTIYTLIHAVQPKNSFEAWKIYSFQLDNNLNIIDVDKGAVEMQIEKNKKIIEQADLAKRLIREVSDMKIASLKTN